MKHTIVLNAFEALTKVRPDEENVLIAQLFDKKEIAFGIEELPGHATVAPHYHKAGLDFFFIISGEGELYTAKLGEDQQVAQEPEVKPLKAGDAYCIDPYILHGVKNLTGEPLVILNAAPANHLTTDIFYPDNIT